MKQRAQRFRPMGNLFRFGSYVFICLSAASLWAQAPLQITAVANSADFKSGMPQRGSVASIFLTGLDGPGGVIVNTQSPLLNQLLDFSVWINFSPAPILSVAFEDAFQQINVQVPWEGVRDPMFVEVIQGSRRATFQTPFKNAGFYDWTPAPGWSVFFVDATGHAIMQHAADQTPVTPQRPAHGGENVIAYAINLGPVSSPPPTGSSAPPNVPSPFNPNGIGPYVCDGADTLLIGAASVSPSYDGLAPGLVGVYQLKFTIPQGQTGDLMVSVRRDLTIFPLGAPCRSDQQHTTLSINSASALINVQE
ncbi:MAG TPA: hypothetical protein VJ746_14945 [Nitrospira sp.]|nr:hypothetical protein [Nitrospira sp.]